MIYILHGEDTRSSYKRLAQILDDHKDFRKIRLEANVEPDKITQEIFAVNLFDNKRIIVIENFLASKKFSEKLFNNIPIQTPIIFWEHKTITKSQLSKLPKDTKIEEFKPPTILFSFLDNITPGKKNYLSQLPQLEDEPSLLWNLQQRFLLLILAKLGISLDSAIKITKRNVFDWQWQKIRQQARSFSPQILKSIYNGLLKIDYMIKQGETNLEPSTLLSVLFIKYLSN